jgi:hypothetical protein
MVGKILSIMMLMLFLSGLTGCLLKQETIVLNEARTVKLEVGMQAPWDGWLLTDGALITLLESVERCEK